MFGGLSRLILANFLPSVIFWVHFSTSDCQDMIDYAKLLSPSQLPVVRVRPIRFLLLRNQGLAAIKVVVA